MVVSADVIGVTGNRLQYLTTDDWVLVQAKAVRRTFKLGDEIIRQGAWGDCIYIIRQGEASVEVAPSKSGRVQSVITLAGSKSYFEPRPLHAGQAP